jgi:hypothetical protein
MIIAAHLQSFRCTALASCPSQLPPAAHANGSIAGLKADHHGKMFIMPVNSRRSLHDKVTKIYTVS